MSEHKAGRELDALVAEKVMGLAHVGKYEGVITDKDGTFLKGEYIYGVPIPHDWDEPPNWEPEIVPHYSTDIAAAWEIVDQNTDEWFPRIGWMGGAQMWRVVFTKYEVEYSAKSVSAPHAIALASLKAVEK